MPIPHSDNVICSCKAAGKFGLKPQPQKASFSAYRKQTIFEHAHVGEAKGRFSFRPFFFSLFSAPFLFQFYFLVLFAFFLFPFFFRLSLFSCVLLFLFLDCLFPFILFYSFLSFSVYFFFPFCCLLYFSFSFSSSLFSFRSFPFFLFPFVSCYFSFVFLPSFLFLDVFGIFPLLNNFGKTYYIILCTCSFISLYPLLNNLFFLLHNLWRGQIHG